MPSAIRLLLPLAIVASSFVPTFALSAQQPTDTSLLQGLDTPVAFAFHGADMYAVERAGRIRVVRQGAVLPQPLLDISEEVGAWRDFGMLGLVLDPAFDTNGYYYVSYVVDRHYLLHYGTPSYDAQADEYLAATITRVTRFTADATGGFTSTVPGSRLVLLGVGPGDGPVITYESHGACQLAFGRDGSLLVATGDGASFAIPGDWGNAAGTYAQQAIADGMMRPEENVGAFRAQMLDSLSGHILRIDPATGDGLPSNPFYDGAHPRSARSRTYALGLRNPCRMCVRPGTGALDPSLGRPGSIFVGDVGWFLREELDVVTLPGQNFGWPLYEGLDPTPFYPPQLVENPDVPNPLAGSNGCGIAHLRFQDLLQQPVEDHNQFFPNPCDPQVGIAPTAPTFVHTPPVLDWAHNFDDARVPGFANGVLVAIPLGSPSCTVVGNQFRGSCSIAGCWHSGLTFPLSFGPAYYHADFVEGWIKRLQFDDHDELLAVEDLFTTPHPLMLGESAIDHGLVHLSLEPEQFHELRYGIEPPPVARPTADVVDGPAPLTVNLDARDSADPQGQPLTYLWNLPDGRTSTAPQLLIRLVGLGTPMQRHAQLTVTDPYGQSDTRALTIAVDNTPPVVAIASFANGDLYSQAGPTTLPLTAVVTDAEHAPAQLTYKWQVALHHNSHEHPEPPQYGTTATAVLSPTSEGHDFFAYHVELTVTDAGGLSTQVRQWLFPDTTGASTSVLLTAPQSGDRIVPGAPVTFQALTTGVVQRVEYYVEGELVAIGTSAPWTATWVPESDGQLTAVALAIAADGTSSSSRGIAIEVERPTVTKVRVRGSSADGVEDASTTTVPITNGASLPLGNVGGSWRTLLQFDGSAVPVRARVLAASVDLTAAAADAQATQLRVGFDVNPSAASILRRKDNLKVRIATPMVGWTPGPWMAGESGIEQRTPDLAAVMQPLVDDPAWNHSLVVMIDGTGQRRAVAYDSRQPVGALLTVAWLPPLPTPLAGVTLGDGVENSAVGTVDLSGQQLVFGEQGGVPHVAAVRFQLDVAPAAKIASARMRFTSAGADLGPAVLSIHVEVADDALPLASNPFDISSRPATQNGIAWYPPEWPTPGVSGDDQRTPELRELLQEIVNRPGWQSGQSVLLKIDGVGTRTAASLDAGVGSEPKLELSIAH